MTPLRTSSSATACKICGGPVSPFGAVDLNQACGGPKDAFPPSGVPVPYVRCSGCGLIFTEAFDDWEPQDFQTNIYNDGYIVVDPDYPETRPVANAGVVDRLFPKCRTELRVLDYGGGNGRFAAALRETGWVRVETYDPFSADFKVRPEGRFDLITCFETFEHLPDPVTTVAGIAGFLADNGAVVYSTLLQPADIEQRGVGWWYIAPRNGHITFFTAEALARIWAPHGLQSMSLSAVSHLAMKGEPPWLAPRLKGRPPKA